MLNFACSLDGCQLFILGRIVPESRGVNTFFPELHFISLATGESFALSHEECGLNGLNDGSLSR